MRVEWKVQEAAGETKNHGMLHSFINTPSGIMGMIERHGIFELVPFYDLKLATLRKQSTGPL